MDDRFLDTFVKADVDLDILILEGGARYRLGEWLLGETAPDAPGDFRKTWGLEGMVGARYTDLEIDSRVDAGFELGPLGDADSFRVKAKLDWVDPIVGLRTWFHLDPKWTLVLKGDVGGFGVGSETTYGGYGLVKYKFRPGMEGVAGYKVLYQDYEEGSLEWDVTWHGPVLGFRFTF